MITLRNWYLTLHSGHTIAHGIVSGHFKLPDGMNIHTSAIREMALDGEEQGLTLLTASGNAYSLPGEDVCPPFPIGFEGTDAQEVISTCMERFGIPSAFSCRFQQLREAAERERRRRAEEELSPGELLLETVGTGALRAFFRTKEGELREIKPSVHSGMFQDSILITDWEGGSVDFRYFPMEGRLEPYHTSDGLTAIRLRNLGAAAVSFGSEGHAVLCPAGETTRISTADHPAEGLFSPDAVNGKSILTAIITEEEGPD